MFTGIVETTGTVVAVSQSGSNRTFTIASSLSETLKTDQSVSHNGVCLTVETVADGQHTVTAIAETLSKTNLGHWQAGTAVNIERCVPMNGRLDGHLVQGHVDSTASCLFVENQDGSWLYTFEYPKLFAHLIIEKGSICLNGISLTVFNLVDNRFSVAIIPYTFEHTNMQFLQAGQKVNIEFDMVGKYLARWKELGV
ncbi:MAG: riboflavin synthase [Bacteroidetes bacterium]|uniref:riboflavin synthase n=1 Tax=Phnomibacter sp. TaxID=2836217 RepID=UPI002FDEA32F|nr:riboflavin synthase [Bacteroidota bacterium]